MIAIVSGSCGLVGSAAVTRLLREGWSVVGIDNGMRGYFFGEQASTSGMKSQWTGGNYEHWNIDIRDNEKLHQAFCDVDLIIHAAAQPAHDWATTHIREDFSINAIGTLNMLDAWKIHCPKAPFIHVSTSKVYGDNPNKLLEFEELPTRWEALHPCGLSHSCDMKGPLNSGHGFNVRNFTKKHEWGDVMIGIEGIQEDFPLDNCTHSFFGVSKLSGDLLAQEYGRHFNMPVGIFRPGCVTGGNHKGAELHGFLSYLCKCIKHEKPYKIIGHKGKQVRCNIHADDLVEAFMLFAANPKPGEVYNIGGRGLDCSILEAIVEFEKRLGKKAITEYVDKPRTGDHIFWVSDCRKLRRDYGWEPKRTLASIYNELCEKA